MIHKWRQTAHTGPRQTCSPVADYKCFNSSNVSIRPWSWNYRSCWHQTCPPVANHHCVWIASIPSSSGRSTLGVAAVRCCLAERVCIGQFARLLPALAVVAISQAPSPESNPDSLLPVRATVVHCTTVQADRSEVHVIKQDLLWTCHAESPGRESPRDQPDSAVGHTAIAWRWSFTRLDAIHHGQQDRVLGANLLVADCCVRVLATRFWRMSNGQLESPPSTLYHGDDC